MNVFLGLFLVGFSGLSLEIALVRLLSVTTWYHLAFFAISTAMLGMTAGGTRVYLSSRTFRSENLPNALSTACVYFSLSVPVTLVLLCLVPLELYKSVMSLLALLITTIACALPFYFAGTIVSGVLTKHNLPMGRLYASNLLGSSMGCLFVLGGLEVFDAPSFILLSASLSALAGVCFAWKTPWERQRRLCLALFVVLGASGVVNSFSTMGVRPVIVKGTRIEPATTYMLERWNSFSRVAVYNEQVRAPQYWGPSPLAPSTPIPQYRMNIDGEAATYLRRFNSRGDIDHLRYDVTNIGYYLNRHGSALVIGVGAGRDVQSAVLFGEQRVVGVEINPIFVDLLKTDFRAFAGLADRPDVTLVTAEARSYLSQDPHRYSIIQMSLIDTWAATGAGAFSLSENSLYTVEAWDLFLSRLEDNGILTVSRWHSPDNIGETGRVVSLAVASLLRRGIQDPARHIALITAGRISTLLVSPQPLPREDLDRLTKTSEELGFGVVLLPGRPPAERLLGNVASARTRDQLSAAIAGAVLNYSPPTDESPYFFNMLRLSNIRGAMAMTQSGVIRGNIIATLTLVSLLATLLLVAVMTIILPLALRSRFGVESHASARTLLPGAFYFAMIGAGFMLTEIALIQRLTVLLSHPLYALGILLMTLIASAGIGSLVSDRLPLTRAPWAYVFPILTAGSLLGLRFLLAALLPRMTAAPFLEKTLASVLVVFPAGLLMGLFFPTGMRLAKSSGIEETPWYWALNGVFGVLCSALAVLVSIYLGISVNLYIASVCYAGVLIAQVGLQRAKGEAPVTA